MGGNLVWIQLGRLFRLSWSDSCISGYLPGQLRVGAVQRWGEYTAGPATLPDFSSSSKLFMAYSWDT